ncbi:hypothetical protein MNBD_GAMMA19-1424, partial [hydrothermal vent metagenome]
MPEVPEKPLFIDTENALAELC